MHLYSKTLQLIVAIIITATTAVLLSACGSDGPTVPRDRDVTFNTLTFNHVTAISSGTATLAGTDNCSVTLHRSAFTADLALTVTINGTPQTFELQGVAIRTIDNTLRYALDAPTTSNPRVTNLHGTIDPTETAVLLHYDVDGQHRVTTSVAETTTRQGLTVTTAQIFYNNNSVTATYTDTTTISNGTLFEYHINSADLATEVRILDLTLVRNQIIYRHLTGTGISLNITPQGYDLTAEIVPLSGNASHAAGSTDGTLQVTDRCLKDFHAELNLITGQQQLAFTLCRIKRNTSDSSQPASIEPITDITVTGTTY